LKALKHRRKRSKIDWARRWKKRKLSTALSHQITMRKLKFIGVPSNTCRIPVLKLAIWVKIWNYLRSQESLIITQIITPWIWQINTVQMNSVLVLVDMRQAQVEYRLPHNVPKKKLVRCIRNFRWCQLLQQRWWALNMTTFH